MSKDVINVAILANVGAIVRSASIRTLDKINMKHEFSQVASQDLVTHDNVATVIINELLGVKPVSQKQDPIEPEKKEGDDNGNE